MVVFLLARMFLKFNVHPSGVLGPSYRRFGSTCTMSIWTRDMEGDANQLPCTTLTRFLHKALALALAPLPRPLEWSGTQSPLAPQILSPAGLKKTCSRLLPLADWTESIIVVLSSYRNRPSGPGLRVFFALLTRISAIYFLLSVKDCHSSGRYASLHFEGL